MKRTAGRRQSERGYGIRRGAVMAVIVMGSMVHGCTYSPMDGQKLSNTNERVRFEGYAQHPNATVRVQGFNQVSGTWADIARTTSSATRDPASGTYDLYAWNTGLTPITPWFWSNNLTRYDLRPGESGQYRSTLRVREDGLGTNMVSFDDRGIDCLADHIWHHDPGTGFSDWGAACYTGSSINLLVDGDVIVLPVHVHVLAGRRGELPNPLLTDDAAGREVVRRWLDPRRGEVTSSVDPIQPDPFVFAQQARIQFALASYQVHRTTTGLEREILSNTEIRAMLDVLGGCGDSRLKTFYMENHRTQPGIHVYLGGTFGDACIGGGYCGNGNVNYGLACGPKCRNVGSFPSGAPRFVAIDATRDSLHASPIVLAHELGHYLGLAHIDEDESCGADLGPFESGNLMHPSAGASAFQLTTGQRSRARTIACQWLSAWGMPSAACS